ncbi:head-tail connector protein [Streptomyces cucumeris]|uniref:head-tail connector protein n=1 Tax=Streptomyces cucumeris TaxID=2962890 RepID=UPI0020C927E3|nr:head-tail connector protein [Streptomyces sp. NEAU-Y11]MCP9209285.1 phage gp6-like head-tail connector protein [Streptomyces sp. NEAU-Y11]
MALLTLNEAKAQLNITTATHDAELQAYVEAVTAMVEWYVGPVEPRTVTETVNGRGLTLALAQIPVVSLTSITPLLLGGLVLDVADLVLDNENGIIRRVTGDPFCGGPWEAVYAVGRGTIPPTLNLAGRMLVQHLWQTQQGPGRPSLGGDDFDVNQPVPGFGYAVPNRVLQLLQPYRLPPGVA